MVPFDGKHNNVHTSSLSITALSLTVFKILTFQMVDLENVEQGHGVQFSQWRHSITNIIFAIALTLCVMLALQKCNPTKEGRGHGENRTYTIRLQIWNASDFVKIFAELQFSETNEFYIRTDTHTVRKEGADYRTNMWCGIAKIRHFCFVSHEVEYLVIITQLHWWHNDY